MLVFLNYQILMCFFFYLFLDIRKHSKLMVFMKKKTVICNTKIGMAYHS